MWVMSDPKLNRKLKLESTYFEWFHGENWNLELNLNRLKFQFFITIQIVIFYPISLTSLSFFALQQYVYFM